MESEVFGRKLLQHSGGVADARDRHARQSHANEAAEPDDNYGHRRIDPCRAIACRHAGLRAFGPALGVKIRICVNGVERGSELRECGVSTNQFLRLVRLAGRCQRRSSVACVQIPGVRVRELLVEFLLSRIADQRLVLLACRLIISQRLLAFCGVFSDAIRRAAQCSHKIVAAL